MSLISDETGLIMMLVLAPNNQPPSTKARNPSHLEPA